MPFNFQAANFPYHFRRRESLNKLSYIFAERLAERVTAETQIALHHISLPSAAIKSIALMPVQSLHRGKQSASGGLNMGTSGEPHTRKRLKWLDRKNRK
jgi:hypothetical protein